MLSKQPSSPAKSEVDSDAVAIAKSYKSSDSLTYGTKLASKGTGTQANFDIEKKEQDEDPDDTTNLMLDA